MKVLVFIFLLAGPMASTPTVAASTTHPPTTTTVPPDTTKSTPPTTTTTTPLTTTPPTTTTPLTTTPPTTTPVLLATKIEIGFSMNETFTSDLADPTSEEFKVLADKVTSALNNVYANVTNFNKSFVTKFSKGSVVTAADLIFNQGSTVNATSAKETLVAAASSSVFDLTVHTASIVTAVLPTTTTTTPPTTTTPLKTTTPTTTTPLTTPPTTTAPPTTATHPTTTRTTPPTASIPPTTTTTPSTTTASPTTTAPPSTSTALLTTKTASSTTTVPPTTTTTATTTPQTTTTTAPSPTTTTTTALNLPSNTEGIIFCQFKIDQVFIPALSDQSSSEYQSLAQKVLTEINRVGKKLYGGNYLRSLINSFKSGSVVVNSTLVFQSKCSVPEAVTAATQLNTELVNSTLNVIQGSVSAQSSGRSLHRTVVSMSILTLLLLAVTHILSDI